MSTEPAKVSAAEYQAMIASQMTEATLQTRVEQHARELGWRFFHAPDNRPGGRTGRVQRITPGFPDLLLVSATQGRILGVELKRQDGRVTAAQHEWLADLRSAGASTYVWRPSDLLDGTVDRILRGVPECPTPA